MKGCKRKNNEVGPMRLLVRGCIWRIMVILLAVLLLVGLGPTTVAKDASLHFSGSMWGHFVPASLPGPQFYVFESALGSIDKGPPLLKLLEASSFSWAAVFIYDHELLPDEACDPDWSSGSEYGHGTMFFSEGDLWLELESGFSCFIIGDWPNHVVNVAYNIVGGTGLFENAEGSLEVTLYGSLGEPNNMTAQFEGKVRLDDDDD